MDKGEYGVTFPFLIGAIARESSQKISDEFVTKIFLEIRNEPVSGYYCEVRWCGNIEEPVASVKNISEIKNVSIQSSFKDITNKNISLAFTTDLMSMFNLDCKTNEECFHKLVARTIGRATKGEFSKNSGHFNAFNDDDIKFIEHVGSL